MKITLKNKTGFTLLFFLFPLVSCTTETIINQEPIKELYFSPRFENQSKTSVTKDGFVKNEYLQNFCPDIEVCKISKYSPLEQWFFQGPYTVEFSFSCYSTSEFPAADGFKKLLKDTSEKKKLYEFASLTKEDERRQRKKFSLFSTEKKFNESGDLYVFKTLKSNEKSSDKCFVPENAYGDIQMNLKFCTPLAKAYQKAKGTPFQKYKTALETLGKQNKEIKKQMEEMLKELKKVNPKEEMIRVYQEDLCNSAEDFNDVKKDIWNYYHSIDMKTFQKRKPNYIIAGEKEPLFAFAYAEYKNKPQKKVLYRNSPGDIKKLKVFQVLNGAVLVRAMDYKGFPSDGVLYIETDQQYVDNAELDSTGASFYEYLGLKNYNALLGSKTVYMFKRVTATDDLIFFP